MPLPAQNRGACAARALSDILIGRHAMSRPRATLEAPRSRGGIAVSPSNVGKPPRLLDRVRVALRVRHYARRTEDAYVAWIRRYIRYHDIRHPD